MASASSTQADLKAVNDSILRMDPDGARIAHVLRDTFDQLYDGQRTGRYRVDQLHKTEKTHFGTLVEINLHKEFAFEDGTVMDYRIAGIEVDCKYSQTIGGWMMPLEARGHLCLVVWAEDSKDPKWSMGLVHVYDEYLNTGGNRDKKVTLNPVGRKAISWLFKDKLLPPNVLLQLDRTIVDNIMNLGSGQKRINELFRNTLGMRVGRAVVATVARQDDYMKRVRNNGGARTVLQPEGIILLGQFRAHCVIAEALRMPVPDRGETVSVRVAPANGPGPGVAEISGSFWRVAKPTDPAVLAPALPELKRS